MSTKSFAVAFGIVCCGVFALPASAEEMTFDDFSPPAGGVQDESPTLIYEGFRYALTPGHGGLEIVSPTQPNIPNNGTPTLDYAGDINGLLTLSDFHFAPFSLTSLDAAPGIYTGNAFFANCAHQIQVTGYFAGGGTITTTITLNLANSPGSPTNFQTVDFTGWTNLDHVEFAGRGSTSGGLEFFQLDNVNATSTYLPEPSSAALAVVACAGLALRRIGRRARAA